MKSGSKRIVGVDIGGSHISAAAVNRESGGRLSISAFSESDVNTFRDADQIISEWSEVIKKAIGNTEEFQIGIAMPGPYDYERGISLIQDQGKMKALFGLSVKNLLSESLGVSAENIAFTNDAEAFLKGESFTGAGRNFQNSIGLTLGTGLGSAIKVGEVVKDAKLWTAPFRDGIAEDYLGTAWFRTYAAEHYGMQITGVKDLISEDFDPETSRTIFRQFGQALGEFLFPYLVRLQSQGVVLGGKISRASAHFLPFTLEYLKNLQVEVLFEISELGEHAALIGATLPFIESDFFSG